MEEEIEEFKFYFGRDSISLEKNELLSDLSHDVFLDDSEAIESDSLGKGSALAGDHHVTFLDLEARGNVDWDVSVSLLESVVLLHVVQEVSSDDD